jgi:hypothetical protein
MTTCEIGSGRQVRSVDGCQSSQPVLGGVAEDGIPVCERHTQRLIGDYRPCLE